VRSDDQINKTDHQAGIHYAITKFLFFPLRQPIILPCLLYWFFLDKILGHSEEGTLFQPIYSITIQFTNTKNATFIPNWTVIIFPVLVKMPWQFPVQFILHEKCFLYWKHFIFFFFPNCIRRNKCWFFFQLRDLIVLPFFN
jgi:hypothetical protein